LRFLPGGLLEPARLPDSLVPVDDRKRPILQRGEEGTGDGLVIVGDFLLGEAVLRVDHPVRVGQLRFRWRRAVVGWRYRFRLRLGSRLRPRARTRPRTGPRPRPRSRTRPRTRP